MTGSALGLALLIAAPAILPGWVARSRGVLYPSDVALLVLAPLGFLLSGSLLNPSWRQGLGEFVYPFVALAVSVAVFYLRVFVLDRLRAHPRSNSVIAFVGALIAAVAIGLMVPPLYE
jgi:hypothetical protein